ncbi:hypothetical protein N657DRAFT_260510 [Parathielavia appendiculata]|uniref:Uncharacterized protein n=1 Tax=Parathielavia appendiculata TaxID=2587402 RepID=A0AAN6TSL7_9PEZI|nr:hypothetical protein N657DRAFT_260510 [Parathielavia appendiculata]
MPSMPTPVVACTASGVGHLADAKAPTSICQDECSSSLFQAALLQPHWGRSLPVLKVMNQGRRSLSAVVAPPPSSQIHHSLLPKPALNPRHTLGCARQDYARISIHFSHQFATVC